MENTIVDVAMQSGAIVGLTAVIGKMIPSDKKDAIMPVVAMIIGVLVMVLPQYVDINPMMQGIVLGGSVTGLYGIAKKPTQK